MRWLGAAGAGFGLLALSHALTIWIFLAALVFAVLHFRSRLRAAAWLVAPVLILYIPWLLRNYLVSGNPAGVAFYALFAQLGLSEAGLMRQLFFDLHSLNAGAIRAKINDNLLAQTGDLFRYFGWSVVALFFFPALLPSLPPGRDRERALAGSRALGRRFCRNGDLRDRRGAWGRG